MRLHGGTPICREGRHHSETREASGIRQGRTVERGSNNVFADLDLPDADSLKVKAGLVSRIDAIIRSRDIAQAEAGRLLGLSQPDVSRLLAGKFREYSLERLLLLLVRLDRDIEIVTRRPRSPASVGALLIADAEGA